jgi:HEAT repeat protein
VEKLIAALEGLSPLERRRSALALGKIGRPAARRAVSHLLAVVSVTVDNELRRDAAIALMSLVGSEDIASAGDLEKLLDDKDPATARAAACALALVGGPKALRGLPQLREQLLKGDALGRERAAVALANLGSAAAPALTELTLGLADRDPVVRRNCCIALAHLGEKAKPAIAALTRALEPVADVPSDPAGARPCEEVREAAAEAIARVQYPGNVAAYPAVRERIARDKNQTVRQRCVWALFNVKELDRYDMTRVLTAVLDETDEASLMVRYDCARLLAFALQDRAPEKACDVLLHMLANDKLRIFHKTDARIAGDGSTTSADLGGDARFMAAVALGLLRDRAKNNPRVVKALRKSARDKEPRLRESARKTLKDLGVAVDE